MFACGRRNFRSYTSLSKGDLTMSKKWCKFTLGVMFASLLAATACAPLTGNEGVGVQSSDGTETIVKNPAPNQTGDAKPGQAAETQIGTPDTQQPVSGETIYSDTDYKFSVAYPADFIFRVQSAEKLAELKPRPLIVFVIQSPKAASSDIAELEPADLEIRIYEAAGTTTLDAWLNSVGLMAGSNAKPFKTTNVSGVELCASTMIAPGCSYFVMSNDRVYQLRPSSLEGENIIKSFKLLP
jgi:hypothetical protein